MKTFNSLAEIQAHEFVGNYYSDQAAFDAIDRFAYANRENIAVAAEALRVSGDKGMGIGREEEKSDQALVDEFIESYEEIINNPDLD